MFNTIGKYLDKFSNKMQKVDLPEKQSKLDKKISDLERVYLALTTIGGRISNEVRQLSEAAKTYNEKLQGWDEGVKTTQAYKDLFVYSATLSKLNLTNKDITLGNIEEILELFKKLDGADDILTTLDLTDTYPYMSGFFTMQEAANNLRRFKSLLHELIVEIRAQVLKVPCSDMVNYTHSVHRYIEKIYIELSDVKNEDT